MSIFEIKDIDTILFTYLDLPDLLTLKQLNKYYNSFKLQIVDEYNSVKNHENKYEKAIKENLNEVVKWFYLNNKNNIPFTNVCELGNIEIAKWMYSLGGINIHANNEEAFRYTCSKDHLELAQWLYSLGGINIHKENDMLFQWCCEWNHLQIAKWIYSLGGVNIHARNEFAFVASCTNGHLETAQWLYSLGSQGEKVNIHVRNNVVFVWSCLHGHKKIAKWLCTIYDGYTMDNEENGYINGIDVQFVQWQGP